MFLDNNDVLTLREHCLDKLTETKDEAMTGM